MITKEDISRKLSELMLSSVEHLIDLMTRPESTVLDVLLCKTVVETLQGANAKEFSLLLDRITGKVAEEIIVNTEFDTLSVEELTAKVKELTG